MPEIRLLHDSDRQGLYDLVEQVNKELVGMFSETHELVEEWVHTIELGVWEVYVAILPLEEIKKEQEKFIRKILPWKRLPENDSGIIGLVTLYGDWKEDEDLEEGDFDIGITVSEAFQKRGIGKEMMKFIIKRGRELNYKRATLWTRIDNFPMQKLAMKLGFIPGRKRRRHGHTWFNYTMNLEEKNETRV